MDFNDECMRVLRWKKRYKEAYEDKESMKRGKKKLKTDKDELLRQLESKDEEMASIQRERDEAREKANEFYE